MYRAVYIAAIVALGACSHSFGERAHEQFHQSVDAGAAPLVRVDNAAGSITIEARPGAVDVAATKYARDEQQLHLVTIDVHQSDGTVAIATTYHAALTRAGVRYRIGVPAGASLRISNVAGAVDIAGVDGGIRVETQAGEIAVDAGTVRAKRTIDLHATTGAVTLSIARGSDASVGAQSIIGDFATDISGITSSRENLIGVRGVGRIGNGSAQIRLTTTTGAIALRER